MTTHRLPIAAALLPMLFGGAAVAESRAAEALNYEFDLDARDIATSGSTSNGTLTLKAAATLPLGSYFALAASAGYSNVNVKTRRGLVDESGEIAGTLDSCDFNGTQGTVTLFARRPTLGRVGVSYGVNKLSSECGDSSQFVMSGDDSLDAKHYRVFAEYYLYDFTLAASHTATDLDYAGKLDSTSVTASWYPLDTLRISASAGNDLYEHDTYGIVLEHQPDFLGDGAGVYVGYSETDQTSSTRTLTIGFSYYFGTRVDLKTRDRQYR